MNSRGDTPHTFPLWWSVADLHKMITTSKTQRSSFIHNHTDISLRSAYFHLLLRDILQVLHWRFANVLTNANSRRMGYVAPKGVKLI